MKGQIYYGSKLRDMLERQHVQHRRKLRTETKIALACLCCFIAGFLLGRAL